MVEFVARRSVEMIIDSMQSSAWKHNHRDHIAQRRRKCSRSWEIVDGNGAQVKRCSVVGLSHSKIESDK